MTFEQFIAENGSRLRAGLVAAYGPEVGIDAASEALAYGWEHRDRVLAMANPAGYLYRVGQTAARRSRRPQGYLPTPSDSQVHNFEPRLVPALERLSEQQRVVVLLVHGYGWSQAEVAELLGVVPSTIHTTLRRALINLQHDLEVSVHDR